MNKASEKYPQWALESYPGLNFPKWERRRRLGNFVKYTSTIILIISAFISVHYNKAFLNMDVFTNNVLFVALVFVASLILVGEALTRTGSKKEEIFKRDLDRLKEKLGLVHSGIYSSRNQVSGSARNMLVWNAVWVRIFELAKNEETKQVMKAEMESNYLLFMDFGLVPLFVPCNGHNHLNLKSYFDAAEPKAEETIRFMLTRLERQKAGLAT